VRLALLLVAAAAFAFALRASDRVQEAFASSPQLALAPVARLSFPTYVASTPADPHAVYVTERTGRV
jgi:hypothetical protein